MKKFFLCAAILFSSNLPWSESTADTNSMLQGMLQGNTNSRLSHRSMLKDDCGYTDEQLNDMHLSNNEMLALRAQKCGSFQPQDDSGHQPASTAGGLLESQRDQVNDIKTQAMQGSAEAQVSLGAFYRGIRNESEATKWFARAAQQGHSMAQVFLGYRYLYGVGATKNRALADFWLRKAADQGESIASEALIEKAAELGEISTLK